MYRLKIISHSEIMPKDIDEIIRIKSLAWPYPYEKQLTWLQKNLKAEDLHLLLLKDDKAVAYLNLKNIELIINNDHFKAFGVGNVCSLEKGKGYGSELMKLTNLFIERNDIIGLLFCKSELVHFYNKFGWKRIEKVNLMLAFDNQKIETMIHNFNYPFQQLKYIDSPF